MYVSDMACENRLDPELICVTDAVFVSVSVKLSVKLSGRDVVVEFSFFC